jgi:hypothetical protein
MLGEFRGSSQAEHGIGREADAVAGHAPFSSPGYLQGLRLLLALCGVFLLAWAILSPGYRDHQGDFQGTVCLPVSLAIGCGILSLTVHNKPWRMFGFWASLALAGQAVSLQMINAGKVIHFQHFRPLEELARSYPWHLAFVAVQTVAVAFSLGSIAPVWVWLRKQYRWWSLAAIGAAFVFSSATLSRHPADYVAELAFSTFLQLLNLATILLAARHLPEAAMPRIRERIDGVLGTDTVQPLRKERLVAGAALWVTVVSAFLAYFVYQNHPHVPDEVIYMFHGRYFAAGRLTLEAPPVPEAFSVYLAVLENGRLYASPPAGWSPVLALGYLAGAPWLVNPVLGGLNILLGFVLFRRITGARTARLATLLLACSPWYVFMCMNFMMHTLTLTCVLTATLGVIEARKTGKSRWAWMAGAAIGYTSLIRPLDGLLTAVILGLWSIGVGGTRLRLPSLVGLVMGAVCVGALVFPYNQHLTGSPTTFPINKYADEYFGPGLNNLGFGPDKGLPFGEGMDAFPGHGWKDVIANGLLNTASLSTELHGWVCGSLLVLFLLVFSGKMSGRDRWMMGAIVITFLGFSTYWFSGGPDFGARYWYLMLIPLLMLTLGGIQYLETASGQGTRLLAMIFLLAGFTVVNYLPWRAIDKYYHYRQMIPDMRSVANRYQFGRDLILIRGNNHPDYASAWIYNPLRFDADAPVYAWLKRPQLSEELVKAFPDRRVWVVDGPTITGSGYRVQGPFPAGQSPSVVSENGR